MCDHTSMSTKCLGNDCDPAIEKSYDSSAIVLDNAYFYVKTFGGVGQTVVIGGANGYMRFSPSANNDAFACRAYLPAGRFWMTHHYEAVNTAGLISIFLNGVAYLTAYDNRTGFSSQRVSRTLITIPAEGEYEVVYRVVGTNGTGYDSNFSHIAFIPV